MILSRAGQNVSGLDRYRMYHDGNLPETDRRSHEKSIVLFRKRVIILLLRVRNMKHLFLKTVVHCRLIVSVLGKKKRKNL